MSAERDIELATPVYSVKPVESGLVEKYEPRGASGCGKGFWINAPELIELFRVLHELDERFKLLDHRATVRGHGLIEADEFAVSI